MRLNFLMSVSIFMSAPLQAAETCRWSQWSEVASSILRSAPEWGSLEKKAGLNQSQQEAADYGPAPRAAFQYLAGAPLTREGEAELRYEWTLERGGKRDARQKLVSAQQALSEAAIAGRKAELLKDLAVTADRLQQIEHEDEILKETVSTYRALMRQLASQAALSPEQDVTLAVFRLAHDETLMKSGQLEVEADGIRSQLAHLTACEAVTLPKSRKQERTSWPEFPNQMQDLNSAWKRRQEAQKAQQKALLDQETAQSIADLSIGPVARLSLEDGSSKPAFGVAASLPLGRTQSQATLQVAQATFSLAEVEATIEQKKRAADYARWLGQYRSAVKVLRQGFAETAVQDKHEKMEKLFLAGRVNASLIIEAHRQMYEHVVSRHQMEWKALEAYWNLRSMNGQLREVDL
ncbi:MAG TPA: hypothetical protein VFO10_22110 [Oligoflexus sp.]|uniref:hypothetical protein n=1 Tax=Oligoflexus sp. TaxID=1971216 RepID=UPI002D7E6FB1|nr:hypothetical protein [Oligoflexus sp.]HET9239972.1 hypothetical protein [Oligoflexus sp.]